MSRSSVDLEKAYSTPSIELGARNGGSSRDDDEAAQAFLPKTTAKAPAGQPPKLTAAMISTSCLLCDRFLACQGVGLQAVSVCWT